MIPKSLPPSLTRGRYWFSDKIMLHDRSFLGTGAARTAFSVVKAPTRRCRANEGGPDAIQAEERERAASGAGRFARKHAGRGGPRDRSIRTHRWRAAQAGGLAREPCGR